MVDYTTDKIGHGYYPTYRRLAAELGADADVCEIGVANGEGLVLFRALFPLGRLVGVDNNPAANFRQDSERTVPIVMSQDDIELPARICEVAGVDTFGLVVDDASHDNWKTSSTFLHMWPMVERRGYYVIEDWNHAGGLCFELASSLPVRLLREDVPMFPDVESIEYRHGLIIIRKKP